jgi:uncharacterized protein (DUF2267 family)
LRNNTIFDYFCTERYEPWKLNNPSDIAATNTAVLEALKRSLEEDKTKEVHPRDAY